MDIPVKTRARGVDSRWQGLLGEQHLGAIAIAESVFPSLQGVRVLELACGHNVPFSPYYFENCGPVLAAYFSSRGAQVTGVDLAGYHQWLDGNSTRKKFIRENPIAFIQGNVLKIEELVGGVEFDLTISVGYFGHVSSNGWRHPNWQREKSVLEQASKVTAQGGYGIHVLTEGKWEIREGMLEEIRYQVMDVPAPQLNPNGAPPIKYVILRKH